MQFGRINPVFHTIKKLMTFPDYNDVSHPAERIGFDIKIAVSPAVCLLALISHLVSF